MGPEISTNIDSMLRAMENVIIPSIDPNNALANEQAYLVMVYLRLIADQHEKIFQYRIQEVGEYRRLLSELLGLFHSLGQEPENLVVTATQLLERSAPLSTLSLPKYSELVETVTTLREASDELVRGILERSDKGSAERIRLEELLLAQTELEALRERSWVAKLGVDPKPGELPALSDLLE